ncbi:MBL fold metallo-hydrolase [Nocardia mexicana]|uniref:Glyoxylase-like metal-dependent hydrolase (Beta-lactamase superfamily II) n=1 Tax=Nocardia mexicana TaxID=279262 RepID=A0A370GJT4_9NOCA|nr:MBL fold metallo-hydrolase [Nocardia mexicana]RDI43630.1 glyoxylase-like metal-dependent hydrolase (beta-lactamase superfamily II) [Nocardia mexicana]
MSLVVERMPELSVTRVSRWFFNCYLVTGDDHTIIAVDPGLPNIADDLESVTAGMPGSVRIAAATHGHGDHVGGAAALARRYSARIHLPAVTLTYLGGTRPRTPSPAQMARAWRLPVGQPFDRKGAIGAVRATMSAGFGGPRGMLWSGPDPGKGLEEGMSLPGAPEWTVLHAPGHTDDSIVFWNERTGALLSGDAVVSIAGRPRFAPDTVDRTAANRTRHRLSKLPVRHLLPGHGVPIHAESVWAL